MKRYILDATTVSDILKSVKTVQDKFDSFLDVKDMELYICQSTYFEVLRGLLWAKANNKLKLLHEEFIPLMEWAEILNEDWFLAAQYWADMTSKGRQFSDMDLLIAAIAKRLDAILVSSDADFDALPITREDWRKDNQ